MVRSNHISSEADSSSFNIGEGVWNWQLLRYAAIFVPQGELLKELRHMSRSALCIAFHCREKSSKTDLGQINEELN